MSKCLRCGVNELLTGDVDGICTSCRNMSLTERKIEDATLAGWQCPQCKKIYSPFTEECKDCNQHAVGFAFGKYYKIILQDQ